MSIYRDIRFLLFLNMHELSLIFELLHFYIRYRIM